MQDSYRKENETEENNRISRYTVIDKLGKGGNGKVPEAWNSSQTSGTIRFHDRIAVPPGLPHARPLVSAPSSAQPW